MIITTNYNQWLQLKDLSGSILLQMICEDQLVSEKFAPNDILPSVSALVNNMRRTGRKKLSPAAIQSRHLLAMRWRPLSRPIGADTKQSVLQSPTFWPPYREWHEDLRGEWSKIVALVLTSPSRSRLSWWLRYCRWVRGNVQQRGQISSEDPRGRPQKNTLLQVRTIIWGYESR